MASRTLSFMAVVASVFIAGCSGTDGDVAPTSSSMMMNMAPKTVAELEADACPPSPPVQTTSTRQRFIVEDGYSQLLIDYGETGEGQVSAQIRFVEENKVVWEEAQHVVNTAPGATCGAHGAHGAPAELSVEPGEYEAAIQYAGAVNVLMTITARSGEGNMTDHGGHMGR